MKLLSKRQRMSNLILLTAMCWWLMSRHSVRPKLMLAWRFVQVKSVNAQLRRPPTPSSGPRATSGMPAAELSNAVSAVSAKPLWQVQCLRVLRLHLAG